jgi:hypothetical protein
MTTPTARSLALIAYAIVARHGSAMSLKTLRAELEERCVDAPRLDATLRASHLLAVRDGHVMLVDGGERT